MICKLHHPTNNTNSLPTSHDISRVRTLVREHRQCLKAGWGGGGDVCPCCGREVWVKNLLCPPESFHSSAVPRNHVLDIVSVECRIVLLDFYEQWKRTSSDFCRSPGLEHKGSFLWVILGKLCPQGFYTVFTCGETGASATVMGSVPGFRWSQQVHFTTYLNAAPGSPHSCFPEVSAPP